MGGLRTLTPSPRPRPATERGARGETGRALVEAAAWLKQLAFPPVEPGAGSGEGAADDGEAVARDYTVEVSGRRFEVKVIGPPAAAGVNGAGPVAAPAPAGARPRPRRAERSGGGGGAGGGGDTLVSPLQGNMWKVLVEQGQQVEEGQLLCIIEAMKMENEITAHKAGTIAELPISEGAPVSAGDTLAVIASQS